MLRFRTAFGLALLGKALLGSAQQSTTIDITGVQFRNATNQSRSSVTPISPAFLYDYQITGSARGVNGALGLLYPNPTPLATIFESLAPGSSALLQGQGANIAGTHPFPIANQRIDGNTVISGITVTYGFDIAISINAAGIVSFSLTNVVLTPAFLVGYIQITSGTVFISRTSGVIGGTMQLQAYDADPTLQPVTIELRNTGSSTPIETHVIQPTAAGTWFLQTSLRGTYDVTAKGVHWLRSKVGNVSISDAGQMNVNFSLVNGDIDQDNEVGIGDYSILSSQYGTAGPEADLNGDEAVDIGDYSILSASFGLAGDD
ncbi:MAG: hypothetical protein K1X67_23685 [Fimbriimonadaceae bacterium]|nr:hypothetical protein [Fimbriimonadaceae bacterium]